MGNGDECPLIFQVQVSLENGLYDMEICCSYTMVR